eukprot:COSAG06_NODE_71179_length_187_cov_21.068182_1_plen_43_part_10
MVNVYIFSMKWLGTNIGKAALKKRMMRLLTGGGGGEGGEGGAG